MNTVFLNIAERYEEAYIPSLLDQLSIFGIRPVSALIYPPCLDYF